VDIPLILNQAGHIIAALICGLYIFAVYRAVFRRSKAIGTVLALGILTRVLIGLSLFWISYLQLPIAKSLQGSPGFWALAGDAERYYDLALGTRIETPVPSPAFVNSLVLWMRIVGVSPMSAMFLNLCLYVTLVLAMVLVFKPKNIWRRDLPCLVGVAAYSFSPTILIHSTQPLKDELASVLIALACFGVFALRRVLLNPRTLRDLGTVACGAIAVNLAIVGTAGIRWYDALIIIGALALSLAFFIFRGRTTPLPRYLLASFIVLFAAMAAFRVGAGPYYEALGADIDRILAWQPPRDFSKAEISRSAKAAVQRAAAIPANISNMTQMARKGFLLSGGATNITVPLREDAAAGKARADQLLEEQHATAAYQLALKRYELEQQQRQKGAAPQPTPATDTADQEAGFRAIPISAGDHLKTVANGLSIIFIPMSLLKIFSVVDVAGGRGLLPIVDLDTVFQDVAIAAVIALLWTRRRAIGDRLPFVVFGLILFGATAVLLGYVVTNFGTLWRMRPLANVPIWMLVLALSPSDVRHENPENPSS
jgi:hypothetical protein